MNEAQHLVDPSLLTLLIGVVSIILFYRYSTRNFDFWKKRGIPYVKPTIPLFGSTFVLLWKPQHEIELERYRELGPFYGYFEGSRPALSVGDVKLVRDITVKNFSSFADRRDLRAGNKILESLLFIMQGKPWKRVRSIVTPTFSTGKIKRMVNIVKDCSQTLNENFSKATKSGKPVNIKEYFGSFSLDVVASSAFSTKLDSHNEPNNKFVQSAEKAFGPYFSFRFIIYQMVPGLAKFFGLSLIPPEPLSFFKNVALQIIEQRTKTGQTRNDFLQLLMETQKEDEQKSGNEDISSNYRQDDSTHHILNDISNKKLTSDEMIAQCVNFFIAGYETVASTLCYASYFLALHPDIQNKLYDELREVLQKTKNEMSYESLQEMKYLDNVISESQRLYPSVSRLERIAVADCQLGDSGITVPKGMVVTIPSFALQKDSKFFPDPEKFDPDRFLPEERAKRDPYTFLPFGAGPRNCVGMRFALMEVKMCLAYVIGKFKILKCPETKVPLEFNPGPGLVIAKSMVLKLEERAEQIIFK